MIDENTLQHLLDRLFDFNALEKNNLYHFIVDTIKNNSERDAAKLILMQFDELLLNKRGSLEETAAEKQEGKVSPIFRRVT